MNASIAYVNGAGSQRRTPADHARSLELLNTLLAGASGERSVRDQPDGMKGHTAEEQDREKGADTPGGFKNDPDDPNNPNEERARHLRRVNR